MPQKRLPSIADRAVCDDAAKWRAGIRWDNVVEKVWKDLGGIQEDIQQCMEKFGGASQSIRKDRSRGKASAEKQGERRRTLEIYGGLRKEIGMKNVLARPTGLRANAETAIPCSGPGPARKKTEVYQ